MASLCWPPADTSRKLFPQQKKGVHGINIQKKIGFISSQVDPGETGDKGDVTSTWGGICVKKEKRSRAEGF